MASFWHFIILQASQFFSQQDTAHKFFPAITAEANKSQCNQAKCLGKSLKLHSRGIQLAATSDTVEGSTVVDLSSHSFVVLDSVVSSV